MESNDFENNQQSDNNAVSQTPNPTGTDNISQQENQLKSSKKFPAWAWILIIAAVLIVIISFVIPLFIVSSSLDNAKVGAQDAKRAEDIRNIMASLEEYKAVNNQYPASINILVPNQLSSIPVDPTTGENYQYYLNNGQYCISAKLVESNLYFVSENLNTEKRSTGCK